MDPLSPFLVLSDQNEKNRKQKRKREKTEEERKWRERRGRKESGNNEMTLSSLFFSHVERNTFSLLFLILVYLLIFAPRDEDHRK